MAFIRSLGRLQGKKIKKKKQQNKKGGTKKKFIWEKKEEKLQNGKISLKEMPLFLQFISVAIASLLDT